MPHDSCQLKHILSICDGCTLTDPPSIHQCMTITALQSSAQMLQMVANEQTKPEQPILKLIKDVHDMGL